MRSRGVGGSRAPSRQRTGASRSTKTVAAMHGELEGEFKESANECVKATEDVMASLSTASLVGSAKAACCSECGAKRFSRRRGVLEGIFRGAVA